MPSSIHKQEEDPPENKAHPDEKRPMRPTEQAHELLRSHVHAGDQVIDATVGNGHDTIFLAGLVGREGQVHGFDIQEQALDSTRIRLSEHPELSAQVTLHKTGHEKMSDFVDASVRAVMFNLGYLPGGDKQVITRHSTTTAALQAAIDLLVPGGIISIVVYTGHSGGKEEATAVENFCRSLDGEFFLVENHRQNRGNPAAPYLIAITRR